MATDGRAGIDAALVRRLVATQFPQWLGLPVTPVAEDGWDNRTYRLGTTMTVRLPTAAGYVAAVVKEAKWLPRLAPALLPMARIPEVLGAGEPGEGYPHPWSIRGWLPGDVVSHDRVQNISQFAVEVAEFIVALQKCDTAGAPLAGKHSWFRGASLTHYDKDVRRCIVVLDSDTDAGIDVAGAQEVWDYALAVGEWSHPPVWFHGDMAPGNLLVDQHGRLVSVIDFGCCGVGDPACDVVIAYTVFSDADGSREAFRRTVDLDAATWARARGWALWKALLQLEEEGPTVQQGHVVQQQRTAREVAREVIADHARCRSEENG